MSASESREKTLEDDLRLRVKRELRKRMRGLRKAHPIEACEARSVKIRARLLELPFVAEARKVALFWPILERHEVDLRPFDVALREKGGHVAYPALDPTAPERGEPPMTFHFVPDALGMTERGSGFAEPDRADHLVPHDLSSLDVVIVPALAIDPAGYRIGYGKGYYDGALRGTRVPKVGVAFDFQLITEVPATPHDVALDWVVTDERTIRCARGETT